MAPRKKATVLDQVKKLKAKDQQITNAKRDMKTKLQAAIAAFVVQNIDLETGQVAGDLKELRSVIDAYNEI